MSARPCCCRDTTATIPTHVATLNLKLAPVGEDLLTYAILEGERAGLWLARLPARD